MIWFLIVVLVAAVIVYAVISQPPAGKRRRSSGAGHRPTTAPINAAEIQARWETIMATSKTGASGLKSAVTEADKLLDHVMRQSGYAGDTMGERLKAAKPQFAADYATYDAVWRAHKLRNTLVHEVGFDLVVSQATEALHDFERGLRQLGALR